MANLNYAHEHLAGLMPTVPVADVGRLTQKQRSEQVAQTTATAVTAEFNLYRAERPGVVKKALLTPEIAYTSDNTNFWTLLMFKRTAITPGTAITFLSAAGKTAASGGTGNLTAWLAADVSTLLDSDITKRTLAAGDMITCSVAKSATTGATFPKSLVEVLVGELSD